MLLDLLEVVEVEVGVAQRVDKLARLKAANLRNKVREKCVGGDIEGYTQEGVGATLIELTGEFALGHIELEEHVAGGQSHTLHVGNIPSRDNHTPRVGVLFYGADYLLNLVDGAPVGCAPTAPLCAVDTAEVAVAVALDGRGLGTLCALQELLAAYGLNALCRAPLAIETIGVVVPYMYLIGNQIADIGVALEEPQQLVYDTLSENLFGGQQWESFGEIEAHLVAEDTLGACACAVALDNTAVADCAQKVEILFHSSICVVSLFPAGRARQKRGPRTNGRGR